MPDQLHGTGEHPVFVPEDDFKVGTDIYQEGDFFTFTHAAGKDIGNNVASDEVTDGGEGKEPAVLVSRNTDPACCNGQRPLDYRHVWFSDDVGRIYPKEHMGHHCITGNNYFINIFTVNPGSVGSRRESRIDALGSKGLQFCILFFRQNSPVQEYLPRSLICLL